MMQISFVVITRGDRLDRLQRSLDRIKGFLCEKEIIVVGGVPSYFFEGNSNVEFIIFTEQDDKGWITRKKNIGCDRAKFPILVVLHDDIVLSINFVDELSKIDFGLFDAAAIRYLQDGSVFDWGYKGENGHFGYCYELTDPKCYIDGTAIIIKKSVWDACKWNEDLFINQEEDVEYSRHLVAEGYRLRAFSQLTGETLNQGHAPRSGPHKEGCNCAY